MPACGSIAARPTFGLAASTIFRTVATIGRLIEKGRSADIYEVGEDRVLRRSRSGPIGKAEAAVAENPGELREDHLVALVIGRQEAVTASLKVDA